MFKKPKSIVPTIALVGGVLAGAMASRVGYGLLPATTNTSTIAMYRGGIAVAAGAGAVFVNGNDAMANLVKGAFIGASVEQASGLIKSVAGNVENKIARQALGMGCPCQENAGGTYAPRFLGQPGRVIPLAPEYASQQYAEPVTEDIVFATAI